ncbi:MAG: hypothetical protein ACSHWU_07645, partial [Marinicella sp.]
ASTGNILDHKKPNQVILLLVTSITERIKKNTAALITSTSINKDNDVSFNPPSKVRWNVTFK